MGTPMDANDEYEPMNYEHIKFIIHKSSASAKATADTVTLNS